LKDFTTRYPNGQTREAYTADANGKKSGTCTEFYENGKVKTEATYQSDILHGPFKSYYESGGSHVLATYRKGQFHPRDNWTHVRPSGFGMSLSPPHSAEATSLRMACEPRFA